MKRFSVLYQLNEQFNHIGAASQEEARTILQRLSADKGRLPVGIYDAKTELVEWEPTYQQAYDQAPISEQANQGEAMILVAQALRRRDSSWYPSEGFYQASFFA